MKNTQDVSSDREIKALPIPEKTTIHSVEGVKGLKIHVYPSGTKVFKYKYRQSNAIYTHVTVGTFKYGLFGIVEATKKANVALAKITMKNIDYVDHNPQNFFELWEDYKKETAKSRAHLKTINEIISRFERLFLPLVKDIPLEIIDEPAQVRPIFLRALKSLQTEDNPRTTTLVKVINQLNLCLDHSTIKGLIKINPVRVISQNFKNFFIKAKSEPRKAFTSEKELVPFFEAVNNYFGDSIVKDCMKWTIMYAVRPVNARMAKWEDIDFSEKVWRIKGSDMKMGEDFVLPLTDTAIRFLKKVRTYDRPDREYIFSHLGYHTPMSDGTMRMALIRMGFKGEVHMHGFRSTFRTMMSEMNFEKKLGFTEEVLSLCIDHKFRKVVRSDESYHRAKFEDGKRKAFNYWHKKLREWGLEI